MFQKTCVCFAQHPEPTNTHNARAFMRYPKPRFQQAYVLHGILSRRFKKHCFARYPKPTSQTNVVFHGVISHGFKRQALRFVMVS